MPHQHIIEEENKDINRVTWIAVFANIFLFFLKMVVGILGNSIALITDGIHSISDTVTDITVLAGVHFGSKEPDPKHPYGHGRLETFSAAAISLVLILVGLGAIYKAGADIAKSNITQPSGFAIAAALVSIGAKEWLFRITKNVAVKSHSSALYANAWHHRSDALSSIAVLIGLSVMLMGFKYGDRIAAIIVGVLIAYVGWEIFSDCLSEFAETSVDQETIDRIAGIINSYDDIRDWHKLRTRTVGREIFLDLHILVDPELDIERAHDISEKLESMLHEQLTRPVNITIHIEPDLPELRR